MGLDLRWPIGLMFSLIGAMLFITGIITNSNEKMYERSLGSNINLWWGLVLLAFGLLMLALAWKGSRKPAGTEPQTPAEKAAEKLVSPPKGPGLVS